MLYTSLTVSRKIALNLIPDRRHTPLPRHLPCKFFSLYFVRRIMENLFTIHLRKSMCRLSENFSVLRRAFSVRVLKTPLAKTARVLAAGVFFAQTKNPLPQNAKISASPPRRRRRKLLACGTQIVSTKCCLITRHSTNK